MTLPDINWLSIVNLAVIHAAISGLNRFSTFSIKHLMSSHDMDAKTSNDGFNASLAVK
jgi:hypothetical protein